MSHYNTREEDLEWHKSGQWITPVLFHCKATFRPEGAWWTIDPKLCMAEETGRLRDEAAELVFSVGKLKYVDSIYILF